MKKSIKKNQSGIAALLTVVIVAAATLIMAYSASLLGLGELELGYTSQKGAEALSAADSCVEEALRRLRLDSNYSGGTLNVGNGSCIMNITANGNDRTIAAESTIGEYHKKIEAQIALSGNVITINSWEEKED